MSEKPVKKYPIIGCCGIDCGLCPRYYTKGSSRCPGCCGPDFFNKHPGCGHITCCVKKKNLEVCAQCDEFQCSKFDSWFGNEAYDSFITHKKAEPNLNFIEENGIEKFIEQQTQRIRLLEEMLKGFDDCRSKSFYCVATALLSIDGLKESLESAKIKIKKQSIKKDAVKDKAKILREILQEVADKERVDLKLRKLR